LRLAEPRRPRAASGYLDFLGVDQDNRLLDLTPRGGDPITDYRPEAIAKLVRAAKQAGVGTVSLVFGFILVLASFGTPWTKAGTLLRWTVIAVGVALIAIGVVVLIREGRARRKDEEAEKAAAREYLEKIKPPDPKNVTTL
jgi:multisubunit Na+/H+ antiporter MnhG subunit